MRKMILAPAATLAALLFSSQAPEVSSTGPRIHGSTTDLVKALSRIQGRIQEADIWAKDWVAVVALLYPLPDGICDPFHPPPTEYWMPAGFTGGVLPKDAQSRAAIEAGVVLLIIRKQDGVTCVVNELRGSRLLVETVSTQEATALTMKCDGVQARLTALGVVDSVVGEIKSRLASQPRECEKRKVRRDAEGNIVRDAGVP